MAADAASNSAVIAGRSHTSTRPASSCRVSSASNSGHSGPLGAAEAGGDTGVAAGFGGAEGTGVAGVAG